MDRCVAPVDRNGITAYVELLQERGANLPYPYSSGIRGSKLSRLRELRVQSGGNPIRVFYTILKNWGYIPTHYSPLAKGG